MALVNLMDRWKGRNKIYSNVSENILKVSKQSIKILVIISKNSDFQNEGQICGGLITVGLHGELGLQSVSALTPWLCTHCLLDITTELF